MTASFSILIPTHNRSKVLEKTLCSLASLDVPENVDLEVVVIANACTDDTVEVVRKWSRSFSFAARVVEEHRLGLSAARNRAIQESRGEIVAFIDDDVWVSTRWLKGHLEPYEQHGADIVGGQIDLWWDAVPRPDWWHDALNPAFGELHRGDQLSERREADACFGGNMSFRRCLIGAVGGFREDLGRKGQGQLGGEEFDFVRRAMDHGARLFFSPLASVKHLMRPDRIEPRSMRRLFYGYGRTSVLVRPPASAWQRATQLTGALRRLAKHVVLMATHRVRGNRSGWVFQRCRAWLVLGRIAALLSH